MTPSLKWRLVWTLLALILFTWLVSAVFLYVSSDEALEEQIDSQLQQYSHMVIYIARVFARQIDEGPAAVRKLEGQSIGGAAPASTGGRADRG
ncbi:MAG: hypothetical protein IPG06_10785 [Haliea sp.]|nr:hypothetical protein [Haliea sp.]